MVGLNLAVLWASQCLCLAAEAPGVRIWGTGASLPVEVYDAWGPTFENHRDQFVEVTIKDTATGSGEGRRLITGELGDPPQIFVGSDLLLDQRDYDRQPTLQTVPIMAGYVLSFCVLSPSHLPRCCLYHTNYSIKEELQFIASFHRCERHVCCLHNI